MEVKPKVVRKPAVEREREILAAAVTVFAEQGYRAVDVQQIADRAGVGKGTVYRYFATKEALFLAALRSCLDGLREQVQAAAEGVADAPAKLKAAMRAYFAFFDAQPEAAELFIQERAEFRDQPMPLYFIHAEAHRHEWRDVFEQLRVLGLLRGVDPDTAQQLLGGMLYGVILSEGGLGKPPLRQRAEVIHNLMMYGLMGRAERS
ncbi:TetR/AcrR family transcriptional regulator [Alkalilimnicola sp. S0819]|uniref:TetR/AcrR family transcriptional regulator n=1 Tax=Alkalilimnicola sp. S0819 TaxID=2613922 RepID=UPI0012629B7F|nr:TetR/AcrR family transcriptional regulator [Alkalilimnicola sp. S0819]KAB7627934.1 TetR/AcrR family transcriptional regulator [Alkalilimnicola sp. S0819]MPQ15572.1 TetR family transcriptional regulator [Alkalilimnicola sp. S0819]